MDHNEINNDNFSFIEPVYDESITSKEQCKGLVFRGYKSMFWTGEKLEERKGLRFLKRKSCKGCQFCSYILDNMNENISGEMINLDNIEDRKLYTIYYGNFSRNWESGIVDDWDVIIEEIKE